MTPGIVAAALVAGALGALVRHLVSLRLAASGARRDAGARGARLPVAVLIVNVVGSFIGGAALALAQQLDAPDLRFVLLSGLAGGLTTFSTFSVETIQLVASGRVRTALASVAANLVGGLLAVAAGWALVSALLAPLIPTATS